MKTHLLLSTIAMLSLISCGAKKAYNQHIYWVNSSKKECQGMGKMSCYEIQKSENLQENNWELLYTPIEGFDYQPGYLYKILVEEQTIENPAADSSSIRYKWIKTFEKKEDERLKINDIWVLQSLKGNNVVQQKELPQIEFNVAEMRVTGTDGCNHIFGNIEHLTSKELIIGDIATTRMACPDMEIPQEFGQALHQVNSYKIDNLHLYLYDKSGNKLMTFKKVD